MTSSSPPSSPASDGARAIPPANTSPAGLWIESNKGGRIDATASFPSRPANPANEHAATIGHIGRYALKRQLGAGGLGAVYAAHDPLLSRLIAVKTLHLDVPEEQRAAFNALFLNEARAAAGLSHPQIVTVFDAVHNKPPSSTADCGKEMVGRSGHISEFIRFFSGGL